MCRRRIALMSAFKELGRTFLPPPRICGSARGGIAKLIGGGTS
jgi:hypothetical protein